MISRQIITGIPFKQNPKLDKVERDAVSHYRDAGENQLNWCYFIPANRWDDRDCYMINGVLRGTLLEHRIIDEDKKTLQDLIPKIERATRKSYAPCKFDVYRGLDNDSWITEIFDEYGEPLTNVSYTERAFGSFSADPNVALKYTKKYNPKNRYLLSRTLDVDDLCLYIDNKECEWLLPPNIKYSFEKKVLVPLKNGGKQITYYIKKVNK